MRWTLQQMAISRLSEGQLRWQPPPHDRTRIMSMSGLSSRSPLGHRPMVDCDQDALAGFHSKKYVSRTVAPVAYGHLCHAGIVAHGLRRPAASLRLRPPEVPSLQ
jgi:hypothetical protein